MSRFVAIAAALALVVSGMLIGGLGTYLIMDRREPGFRPGPPGGPPMGPPRPGPEPSPFPPELEMRLDLTEAQRDQIETILFESRHEADGIRRELRPKLEAHLEATRKKIAEVLTPAQREKFEKLTREERRRIDRAFIEGPRPGPPMGPPPGGGPRFPPPGPPR